jgi:hypothetical protein
MCVFCPISLILLYLVKNKPSNYDVPYQAILSSFFSFATFKAEAFVDISITKHTHILCSSLIDRNFQAYGKEPLILQFYLFMLSVLLCQCGVEE